MNGAHHIFAYAGDVNLVGDVRGRIGRNVAILRV